MTTIKKNNKKFKTKLKTSNKEQEHKACFKKKLMTIFNRIKLKDFIKNLSHYKKANVKHPIII
jgi:hypothetical protein